MVIVWWHGQNSAVLRSMVHSVSLTWKHLDGHFGYVWFSFWNCQKAEHQQNGLNLKLLFQKQLLLHSTIFAASWTLLLAFCFSKWVEIERRFTAVLREIERGGSFHDCFNQTAYSFPTAHSTEQIFHS